MQTSNAKDTDRSFPPKGVAVGGKVKKEDRARMKLDNEMRREKEREREQTSKEKNGRLTRTIFQA